MACLRLPARKQSRGFALQRHGKQAGVGLWECAGERAAFRSSSGGEGSPHNGTLSRDSRKEWMELCKQLEGEHPVSGTASVNVLRTEGAVSPERQRLKGPIVQDPRAASACGVSSKGSSRLQVVIMMVSVKYIQSPCRMIRSSFLAPIERHVTCSPNRIEAWIVGFFQLRVLEPLCVDCPVFVPLWVIEGGSLRPDTR